MERGIQASLSADEEDALRIVASGSYDEGTIPAAHIARLSGLLLIEERDGRWRLTASGVYRMTAGRKTLK